MFKSQKLEIALKRKPWHLLLKILEKFADKASSRKYRIRRIQLVSQGEKVSISNVHVVRFHCKVIIHSNTVECFQICARDKEIV